MNSQLVFCGNVRRGIGASLLAVLLCGASVSSAKASGPDATAMDAVALGQLETRAEHADLREQCFLYTEVLHGLTELAGRQLAAGQLDDASATVLKIDTVTGKIQNVSAKDAKRLKNVEQMLEHATRRLSDMAHVASGEERSLLQSTLAHMDKLHTSILMMVFAH